VRDGHLPVAEVTIEFRERVITFPLDGSTKFLRAVSVCEVLRSTDGSVKLVQKTKGPPSGASIETGVYHTNDGDKVCLSSQIGCAMRCSFCKTGQEFEYAPGLVVRLLRNLSADEIVDQALNALQIEPTCASDLTFAFMGMGEPFANLRAVKESSYSSPVCTPARA
jgi:23S rRNA (adenine2503-C2)-methyltransferase